MTALVEAMKAVHFHNYQQLTAWATAVVEKLAFGSSSLLGNASVLKRSYRRNEAICCVHLQEF
jgi:hypothetical protein